MKILLLLSFICALVAATTAATAMGVYKDPEHPGKCVVDDKIMSPGEVAYDPSCVKIFCKKDSVVYFHSCGSQAAASNHKLGDYVNPNANYPACCERELILIA